MDPVTQLEALEQLDKLEEAMAIGKAGAEESVVKIEAENPQGRHGRGSDEEMSDEEGRGCDPSRTREVPAIPAAGSIIHSSPPSSIAAGRHAGDLLNIALQDDHLEVDVATWSKCSQSNAPDPPTAEYIEKFMMRAESIVTDETDLAFPAAFLVCKFLQMHGIGVSTNRFVHESIPTWGR